MNETRPREYLVRNIDALNRLSRQGALRRQLRRCLQTGVPIERHFFRKLPITGPDIPRSGNDAVLDLERIDADTQPIRRQFQEYPADFGAGVPQRAAGLLH